MRTFPTQKSIRGKGSLWVVQWLSKRRRDLTQVLLIMSAMMVCAFMVARIASFISCEDVLNRIR
jgi:hypothetical protein